MISKMSNNASSSMESLIGRDTSSSEASGDSDNNLTSPYLKIPWEDKLLSAESFKDEGNCLFKLGESKNAIKKYHKALLYLKGVEVDKNQLFGIIASDKTKTDELSSDIEDKLNKLTADCHNNIAACLLAQESPLYERVLDRCNQCLKLQPNNLKATYRKGVALFHMKKIEEALGILKLAFSLPEGSKDSNIKKYIGLCQLELKEQDTLLKDTCKAMFPTNKLLID